MKLDENGQLPQLAPEYREDRETEERRVIGAMRAMYARWDAQDVQDAREAPPLPTLHKVIADSYQISGISRGNCWRKLVAALGAIDRNLGMLHFRHPEGRSNIEYAGVWDPEGNSVGMVRVEWHTDHTGFVSMFVSLVRE